MFLPHFDVFCDLAVTEQILGNMECSVLYIIYMYISKETNWPLQIIINVFVREPGLSTLANMKKAIWRNLLSMVEWSNLTYCYA